MAKRIVTKIGDIFCVEVDNEYKRYFQYIANDMTQLNSSVIRVFKRNYPMDYVFNADDVIDDEIDFYSHTILRFGIVYEAWYKVGKNKNIGALDHILFRQTLHLLELYPIEITEENRKSYTWYIWHIGENMTFVGELTKDLRMISYPGSVFPYSDIYHQIKTGESERLEAY